jgi:hypothetical protein
MVDRLRGLKENVIMGRIIPAGTGIVQHQDDIVVDFAGAPVAGREEHPAAFSGNRHGEPTAEEVLLSVGETEDETEIGE